MAPDRHAPAEPAGDEVDEEDHVRDEAQREQGVDRAHGEDRPAQRSSRVAAAGAGRGASAGQRVQATMVRSRDTVPRPSQVVTRPGAQQLRHQGAGGDDADADAGEHDAADPPAPVGANDREHGGGDRDHQQAAAEAGEEAPEHEPGEAQPQRAGEEGGGGDQHHQPHQPGRAHAAHDRARADGTGEVADEVGGGEVGGVGRAEPAALDQGR